MGTTEATEFERNLASKLEKKFPGIEQNWNELTNTLGPELFNLMKSQVSDNILNIEGLGELHLSVVIDTNFIFGQIKTAVEKDKSIKSSFIHRLINSSFISIYAPPKLEEELFEKIAKILEAKNSLAESYANALLEKIKIEDAFWADDWTRAKNMIGDTDVEDVPFLALALHTKSNAIISFDKVFKKQNVSKAWDIKDTEDVIHTFNHGIVSFLLFGTGVNSIKLFYDLIVFIFKALAEVIHDLISGIILFFSFIFDSMSKLSTEIIISMLTLFLGGLFISEELRNKGKEVASKVIRKVKSFLDDLSGFLNNLRSIISELWEAFKPVGLTTLEFIAFISYKFMLMTHKVNEFEVERAKM